jgi:hypothetical protein
MYILVKYGNIKQYPYSIGQLKADNPQTSFPYNISESTLEAFGVYSVVPAEYPQVDYTKNVVEETPNLINGVWYQTYTTVDATEDEISQRKLDLNAQAKINRAEAYRNESDPLFFKWQRGEATEQEWLDKVNEIKQRYQDIP